MLDGPPEVNQTQGTTSIALTSPLTDNFIASGTVVMANVVTVTQGETVRDEVLGNGNGLPFQSYALKKTPLTYLPTTDVTGLTAVTDTLIVTVNGVAWTEVPTLLGAAPNAQVFVARTDDEQVTTVSFGDGSTGAMPPTGISNIHARYRRGQGTSGNLGDAAIRQLIDSVPGLQSVTNPVASGGGADPAGIDDIRLGTPASLSTFGRAVSLQDYAALALQFPSIAKATASWVERGPDGKPVSVPYVQVTVATNDGTPIAGTTTASNLRNFIDSHRDANIPLKISDFVPVYVDVTLTVDILDQFPRQATLSRVTAALSPDVNPDGSAGYFSFQRSAPGASLHLAAVYAVAQAIEGVRDVVVTLLRPAPPGPNNPTAPRPVPQGMTGSEPVWNDVFVRPNEIIAIADDPADPATGQLTVKFGSGGFADT